MSSRIAKKPIARASGPSRPRRLWPVLILVLGAVLITMILALLGIV